MTKTLRTLSMGTRDETIGYVYSSSAPSPTRMAQSGPTSPRTRSSSSMSAWSERCPTFWSPQMSATSHVPGGCVASRSR